MERKIKLIKNRSDIGAGTRGADMGVDAIEVAAINSGSDFFNRFPFVDVPTANHAVYEAEAFPHARRIGQVSQQCLRVAGAVSETLEEGYFPLVFAGDHSSALGTIAGIKAQYPDKTLGVVWIDAHADIHSPYTTPPGNMHGMPLAAALQLDNRGCGTNELNRATVELWGQLKTLVTGERAKLDPQHLVYFGVRDTEEQEDALMAEMDIRNYTIAELKADGIQRCVEQALHRVSDCGLIYISFDVDVMDSELVSDGTGTPVPKGLDKNEVMVLLEALLQSEKVVCLEVVEVNPLLDSRGNRMAETAFEIVEQVSGVILD